ncbi:hypothetical protein CK203_080218 [Vitis vinifera]|uniref:Uncharacterized protein n=1 Tax=Vitis vinifera TaxID=29760 RepID=A0A438ENU8_VITVI|nr:hypothetical protein CK203_080218 [Vitis vinifera]
MEPSRGLKRKRKRKRKRKAEAKVEENGLATSPLSQPLPLDWWDDFSKRITGKVLRISFFGCFEVVELGQTVDTLSQRMLWALSSSQG